MQYSTWLSDIAFHCYHFGCVLSIQIDAKDSFQNVVHLHLMLFEYEQTRSRVTHCTMWINYHYFYQRPMSYLKLSQVMGTALVCEMFFAKSTKCDKSDPTG